MYTNSSKLSCLSLAINQNAQKARALTGSTFGIYSRFRSGLKTKSEPVDSLNFFNDTYLIKVILVSVFQPNKTFYLSKRWGSIRGVLIYRRKSRVCNQYTRQDCPMEITGKKSFRIIIHNIFIPCVNIDSNTYVCIKFVFLQIAGNYFLFKTKPGVTFQIGLFRQCQLTLFLRRVAVGSAFDL